MVRTTCPYCGVGCGVRAEAGEISGDPDHPANQGRLCVKGTTLGLTLDDRERLIAPRIEGREANWDEALDLIATRFRAAIAAHGPDAVAFYVSGQFLTEDYYIANKLMKGFIGSGNIDTNSRLCMASPVAAHIRAFGEDVVPGTYEDFEQANLILFSGPNAAWCHPVLFQRALAAREKRGSRIVVIDPRRSASADLADLHVPLAPGGDGALFAALLAECARRGALDDGYIARHTVGFAAALTAAEHACHSIHPALFETLADWVSVTPRMVTAFSQGVNQSAHGTEAVRAIINLHLATGRIGKPGAALSLPADATALDYADARRSLFRFALLNGPNLLFLLHLAPPEKSLPAPEALEALFAHAWDRPDPATLFAERVTGAPAERILCACHQVTERTIRNAIARNGLTDPAAIGQATRAGTGCGSCLSELKGLLRETCPLEPA